MSQGIVFHHNTLKLPCKFRELQIDSLIDGYKILKILSIDQQKSVFLLEPDAVLCVRHENRKLPNDLTNALQNGVSGLVRILKEGTLNHHWYTIDQKLSPLPDWDLLDDIKRISYVKQMIQAINNLHNLGYCHLDIKTEHFGVDLNGEIRIIDFDSSLPFSLPINENANIEYTPEYAAPEILEGKYSTASDYYSLGLTLKEWGNLNPEVLYLNWKKVIKNLLNPDYSSRYNYIQLAQVFENRMIERNTGPRSYRNGILVGNRKAYSDNHLALILSQDYDTAVSFVRRSSEHYPGNTDAEIIARLIHHLDPSLPLWWKGKAYSSTQEVGRALSSRYPQKDPSMRELLSSGVLLIFNAIANNDHSLVQLLQNARENSERYYWEVSRAFGGRYPIEESHYISLTNLSSKVSELNSLVASRIQHGDPVTVASVLERINNYPNSQNIDSVITQIRAIPVNTSCTNLTNICTNDAFGKYIETRLPELGHYSESISINDLYSSETLYLISQEAFDQWKASNQSQRNLRHQRNVSIGKAIGWTALGLAFLAILPYILAALAIIAIIIIILSIL